MQAQKDPLEVEFTKLTNRLGVEDLVIGDAARSIEEKEKNFIREEKLSEFYATIQLFLQTSIIYLKEKLPFADKVLMHAEVADPACQMDAKFSALRYFIQKYPVRIGDHSRDELEAEFCGYQMEDIKDHLG